MGFARTAPDARTFVRPVRGHGRGAAGSLDREDSLDAGGAACRVPRAPLRPASEPGCAGCGRAGTGGCGRRVVPSDGCRCAGDFGGEGRGRDAGGAGAPRGAALARGGAHAWPRPRRDADRDARAGVDCSMPLARTHRAPKRRHRRPRVCGARQRLQAAGAGRDCKAFGGPALHLPGGHRRGERHLPRSAHRHLLARLCAGLRHLGGAPDRPARVAVERRGLCPLRSVPRWIPAVARSLHAAAPQTSKRDSREGDGLDDSGEPSDNGHAGVRSALVASAAGGREVGRGRGSGAFAPSLGALAGAARRSAARGGAEG